ncbi:hypothetical protein N9K99_04835 [Schleiferiaceae bacterium]|nr:hypothetical protein [Schleiferiaceae bacterium]
MKLTKDISSLDIKIASVEGIVLSSPYGDNKVFGQPKGLKTIGVISITLENGIVGYGETYSGIYSPELIKPVSDFYLSKIKGLKLKDLIDNLDPYFDLPFIGFDGLLQSIKSAFSVALLDCLSRYLEIPIYELFGKKLKPINAYVSGGSVAFDSNEVLQDAVNLKGKGFERYKMRMGLHDLKSDLARIKNAYEVFGSNENVIVDMIQGTLKSNYSTKDYLEIFSCLNEYNLGWVEEPTEPWRINNLPYIKSVSQNKIGTGEAYSGLLSFYQLIDNNMIDIIQYDVTHSGSIDTCFEVSRLAYSKGIDQVLHVWGSSLSLHSNAIFALINDNINLLEYPSVNFALSDDMRLVKHSIIDGALTFESDFLGTGIQINTEMRNKYAFVKGSGYSIIK